MCISEFNFLLYRVVCGTPNYLAPEVIAKKGHSFKSDIWALGCIMYVIPTAKEEGAWAVLGGLLTGWGWP